MLSRVNTMKNNSGFTLTEILTAMIIVTILVTMAVPLYEKTIERSRMTEARTILAKLQDAKLYAMDNMGCTTFDTSNPSCPQIRHLNIAFMKADPNEPEDQYFFTTDAFRFSIAPQGTPYPNAVCAERLGGDYDGTIFLYAAPGVVADTAGALFICSGAHCPDYGRPNNGGNITCWNGGN